MTIEAKIVCDSIGPNGVRLTTFVLKYPRFVHSEFMTHRMLSRNASSSRAIPFNKQIEMIRADLAKPVAFRLNQKGMQAGEDLADQQIPEQIWKAASEEAIRLAEKLSDLGVHKQYVNRLIEPFSHIRVVCTATEYANFFALRHHSMAQPELAELAKQMWETYKTNTPKQLTTGDWHLPFVTEDEFAATDFSTENAWLSLIKSSVARCARISYNNHDGTSSTYEQDCALYDRLVGETPKHSSPAEHQAQVDQLHFDNQVLKWSGNFRGWTQYRKTLKDENIIKFEGPLG